MGGKRPYRGIRYSLRVLRIFGRRGKSDDDKKNQKKNIKDNATSKGGGYGAITFLGGGRFASEDWDSTELERTQYGYVKIPVKID